MLTRFRPYVRVIVALAFLTFVVGLHEAGHALEMLRHGVPIQEFGIGYPIDTMPHLSFEVGGMIVAVHPLLLGAYVKVAEAGAPVLNSLPYGDVALIVGAGVWVNLLTALVCAAICCHLQRLTFRISNADAKKPLVVPAALLILAIAGLLFVGKFYFTYVFAFIGLAFLLTLAYVLRHRRTKVALPREDGGMIGTIQYLGEHVGTRRFDKFFKTAGIYCLVLAGFNMLPLYPLDGGWIAILFLESYVSSWFANVAFVWIGWCLLLLLIAYTLAADIRFILKRVFKRQPAQS